MSQAVSLGAAAPQSSITITCLQGFLHITCTHEDSVVRAAGDGSEVAVVISTVSVGEAGAVEVEAPVGKVYHQSRINSTEVQSGSRSACIVNISKLISGAGYILSANHEVNFIGLASVVLHIEHFISGAGATQKAIKRYRAGAHFGSQTASHSLKLQAAEVVLVEIEHIGFIAIHTKGGRRSEASHFITAIAICKSHILLSLVARSHDDAVIAKAAVDGVISTQDDAVSLLAADDLITCIIIGTTINGSHFIPANGMEIDDGTILIAPSSVAIISLDGIVVASLADIHYCTT